MSHSPKGEDRLTIWANSNTSRGKFAAAAVHAALNWYGIDHRAVIVLGAKPGDIEEHGLLVVHDAGRTEVVPGTATAGIISHENAPKGERSVTFADIEGEVAYERSKFTHPSMMTVEDVMNIVKKHV